MHSQEHRAARGMNWTAEYLCPERGVPVGCEGTRRDGGGRDTNRGGYDVRILRDGFGVCQATELYIVYCKGRDGHARKGRRGLDGRGPVPLCVFLGEPNNAAGKWFKTLTFFWLIWNRPSTLGVLGLRGDRGRVGVFSNDWVGWERLIGSIFFWKRTP
jgi:hypothetical protein